jgi:AcrR family transcriptional regulator
MGPMLGPDSAAGADPADHESRPLAQSNATLPRTEFTESQIRILDAAAEEFMDAGFDATSIDDIARRVGQTKGLIYYHFRSKVEIFYAVYERAIAVLRDQVGPHAAAPAPGIERLERMAKAHLVDLTSRLAYHDVLRQGLEQRLRLRLTEDQRQALSGLNKLRDEYESLFRNAIAEGIADGTVRQLPIAVAARTLLGGLNAVDLWYRYIQEQSSSGIEDVDELASVISDLLVRGFRRL